VDDNANEETRAALEKVESDQEIRAFLASAGTGSVRPGIYADAGDNMQWFGGHLADHTAAWAAVGRSYTVVYQAVSQSYTTVWRAVGRSKRFPTFRTLHVRDSDYQSAPFFSGREVGALAECA
jgi:hypothetical protein